MRLARYLHALLEQHPEFEPLTQSLSITTFRYVPARFRAVPRTAEAEEYVDRLNQELLVRIEQSGRAFLSNAIVNGRFALRACIVNFRTSQRDVDVLLPLVAQLGREADGMPTT
jgi:aromatic-L-amino-acid decarboxylase